jgi:hypothetical protein
MAFNVREVRIDCEVGVQRRRDSFFGKVKKGLPRPKPKEKISWSAIG